MRFKYVIIPVPHGGSMSSESETNFVLSEIVKKLDEKIAQVQDWVMNYDYARGYENGLRWAIYLITGDEDIL